MGNTIGKFDYRIVKMDENPNENQLPFNPIVTITLNNWSTSNEDNVPTISAHLMTEDEIDYHIRARKDDLDAVGKRAKVALRKATDEARRYKSQPT